MPQEQNENLEKASDRLVDGVQDSPSQPTAPIDGAIGDENDENSDHQNQLCNRPEFLEECKALVNHVANYSEYLAEEDGSIDAFNKLSELVCHCCDEPQKFNEWHELVLAYAKVTHYTYAAQGINGRSVLDTLSEQKKKSSKCTRFSRVVSHLPTRYHQRSLRIAIVLSLSGIVLQIITGWAGRVSDPTTLSEGWQCFYYLVSDLIPILIPAVWGAIGSCVFLMKRIADKLSEFQYLKSRRTGDGLRIFLGAILGVIVVQLFFQDSNKDLLLGEVNLVPMTTAFVAGLGVKTVYAAFESIVEGLAARLSSRNKPNA